MPPSSNNNNTSVVANEIDAIIARVMEEYQAARGTEVSANTESAPVDAAAPASNTFIGPNGSSIVTIDAPIVTTDAPTLADYPIRVDTASTEPDINTVTWESPSAELDDIEEAVEAEEDTSPNALPENSNSALVSETTSRFSSAIWYDNVRSKDVILAGVGGIGSYVAFLLSRLQPCTLTIYDDDIVSAGNLSGQLYSRLDIGESKVESIRRFMNNYSDYYDVYTYRERYEAFSQAADIMICGFDNMEARHIFYNNWKTHTLALPEEQREKCLFIDGRLAAENFQVFCIKGDDSVSMARYEEQYLFSDEEADETICSYKQTSFMATMIGSVMVNLFVNFCANQCNPLIPRDLPFYTEYTAETMYFKVVL